MSITEQLELLSKGIDPMTGEIFDVRIFGFDERCNNAVNRMARVAFPKFKYPKFHSVNDLNRPSKEIFEKLRQWRLELSRDLDCKPFMIFSNTDLENIANSDAMKKEDLLEIRGIDQKRYELYGDDIFNILSEYIE